MKAQQRPSSEPTPWSAKVFAGVGILAVVFLILVPLTYRWGIGSSVSHTSGEWNNFGTFVGGVLGPILSTLAFLALIYTIFLQEQQLSLARKTLKAADEDKELTQKQLTAALRTQEATSEALTVQNKATREQATQSKFFELLRLHHQLADSVKFRTGMTLFEGREALRVLYDDEFTRVYKTTRGKSSYHAEFDKEAFLQFYRLHGAVFGHYLRNVYQIFKFIDASGLDYCGRQELIGFLRAQLSNDELGLIYYYGASNRGHLAKPLFEKYHAFRNFIKSSLKDPKSFWDYELDAWGGQKPPKCDPPLKPPASDDEGSSEELSNS